jgi:hypothetical protein
MTIDNSFALDRSKSPQLFWRRKNGNGVTAAGAKRMSVSVYSQPWKNGYRGNKFKHPNYQSNSLFYETSPNMREEKIHQFTTTSRFMHSLGSSSYNATKSPHRQFIINGKITERITRNNDANAKNYSWFDLTHENKIRPTSANIHYKRPGQPFHIREAKPQIYRTGDKNIVKQVRHLQNSTISKSKSQNIETLQEMKKPIIKAEIIEVNAHEPQSQNQYNNVSHSVIPWKKVKLNVEDLQSKAPKQFSLERHQDSDFHNRRTPELGNRNVQDEPEVITLDLHEPMANQYSNSYNQSNDDYGATTLNNAFERHLERQEDERHQRYVTEYRKEMQPSPMLEQVDVDRERMYDLSSCQTNGATLELSDDPFYAAYKRKSKVRNDRSDICYDEIVLRNKIKEEKYIKGNGCTVDIKPDPKYLYDSKKWESERFKVIELQIKENSDRRQQQKINKMRDLQEFNDQWMETDKVITKENFQRKMSQINMVTDEMHRLEAKRVKEYAEARLEQERVKNKSKIFNENW